MPTEVILARPNKRLTFFGGTSVISGPDAGSTDVSLTADQQHRVEFGGPDVEVVQGLAITGRPSRRLVFAGARVTVDGGFNQQPTRSGVAWGWDEIDTVPYPVPCYSNDTDPPSRLEFRVYDSASGVWRATSDPFFQPA